MISSRIRLARNLAEFPFVHSHEERTQFQVDSRKIETIQEWTNIQVLELERLDEVDRQFLVERQLMSREMADGEGDRSVVIDLDERLAS